MKRGEARDTRKKKSSGSRVEAKSYLSPTQPTCTPSSTLQGAHAMRFRRSSSSSFRRRRFSSAVRRCLASARQGPAPPRSDAAHWRDRCPASTQGNRASAKARLCSLRSGTYPDRHAECYPVWLR
jgi:hypothetical protein